MNTIRLDKLLANLAYGSRREAGIAVKRGAFLLDGHVVRDPAFAVPLEKIRAGLGTFEGESLDPISPLTLMLHKPCRVTCSHDEAGKLVYDLLPVRWRYRDPALSSAGRLDKDSSGLVILTDDGDLLHRIISPKTHVLKRYMVTLCQTLKGNESTQFASGTFLMHGDTKPLKPAIWTPKDEKSGVMILQEGRYHQIRRMFKTIGNEVERLHRFRIGALELGDLAEGSYRLLCPEDMTALFNRE